MEISLGMLGWHFQLFKTRKQAYWTCPPRNMAAAEGSRLLRPEKCKICMEILSTWDIWYVPLDWISLLIPRHKYRFKITTNSKRTEVNLLGSCDVYVCFTFNSLRIVPSLDDNLKKEQHRLVEHFPTEKWCLSDLKHILIAAAVLAEPYNEGHSTLDFELGNKQFCRVKMPGQPGGGKKPPMYWPRTLNAAKQNYDTTHHDCFVVFWFILLRTP